MHGLKGSLFRPFTILFILMSGAAFAETVSTGSPSENSEQLRERAQAGSVSPLTSRFILNGVSLDYGSKSIASFGVVTGTDRSSNEIVSGTHVLSRSLSEGEAGGIYARQQSGWYLQLGQMDRKRQVSITQQQAVDMMGFRLQLSATGSCMFPGAPPGTLCTYTPGIATSPDAIHPDLLIPTRLIESSKVGDIVSQETQDSLKDAGWQRGLPDGPETVGIDMDIINSGTLTDNDRTNENRIDRQEKVQTRGVVTLARVKQNLYSNSEHASLDRTIRGFVLLESDEWSRKAVALQALAWVLPGANAKLPSSGTPNLRINNNLFFAANNQWAPRDSYTVFQTGAGHTAHMTSPPKDAWDTPPAWYNGMWMGFSPVRSINSTTSFRLKRTGERMTTHGPYFIQGDAATELNLPDSAITIIDDITNVISQIDLTSVSDLFVQSGLELTRQAALAYSTTSETSYYSLAPHIAFAGNRTDGAGVFRYYAGAIFADDRNAYVGADYTAATRGGVNLTLRVEKYSNPDRDFYSYAEVKATKTHNLAGGNKFGYGISGRKAFDRPRTALDQYDSLSDDSLIDFLGHYETSNGINYYGRHRISDDDDRRQRSTTLAIGYKPSDRLTLTGQVTPVSSEDSYIRAQAGLSWRVTEDTDSGTLQLHWADIKYDYGTDSTGTDLETSERTFLASFQMKF